MSEMGTGFPTLGTILQARGYSTGGVVSSRVLSPEFGVSRGFQHYDVNAAGDERDAMEVTDLALDWLDRDDGEPFFLFVHYFDPHLPYRPPAPYDTLFGRGGGTSIGSSFDIKPLLEDEISLQERLDAFTRGDWNSIISLYDGEIAFTDMAIGRLLSGLEDRGLGHNTLVVMLSDHGEEFYEHGGLGHGHTLFNEVIRVPLILSLPGQLPEGRRVSGQVRMVDVLPTVLDVLGMEGDLGFEGVTLLGMVEGKGRAQVAEGGLFPVHVAYSEGLRRGSERKSVSAYPWKLIHDTETGSDLIFNLADDPGELGPVTGMVPEAAALMKDAVLRNLLRMEDTWYVEMVPGKAAGEFTLRISVVEDLSRGRLTFCRLINADGTMREPDGVQGGKSSLALQESVLGKPLRLAFQVDAPPGLPVAFDLSIDGKPAVGRVYVGGKPLKPQGMPFSLLARRKGLKTYGPPADDGLPPHFVIWRSEAERSGRRTATLGSETREELRALGYVH
jgi:hypothetical protein